MSALPNRTFGDVRPGLARDRCCVPAGGLRVHLPPGSSLMSRRPGIRPSDLDSRVRLPLLRPLPRGEALGGAGLDRPARLLRDRPRRARAAARPLHGPRVLGRRRGLHAPTRARSAGARLLPDRPYRPGEGTGLEELRQDGRHLHRRLLAPPLCAPPVAEPSLPQPRRPARRPVAHLAEHDRELRDEHELAVLRRRVPRCRT